MHRLRRPARTRSSVAGRLALVLGVVLCLLTLPSGTRPARAAEVYFDDTGSSHATFGANQEVDISGDLSGGCYDQFGQYAAWAYVVPHGSINPSSPAALGDHPQAVIQTDLAGGAFFGETVGFTGPGGHLGDGDYDVVLNTCTHGHYDPATDVVAGADQPHGAFTVQIPTDVPLLPSAQIAAVKANAEQQAQNNSRLAKVSAATFAAYDVYSVVSGLLGSPAEVAVNFYLDWVCTVLPPDPSGSPVSVYCPTVGPGDLLRLETTAVNEVVQQALHWQAIADDPPDPVTSTPVTLDAVPYVQPQSGDPVDAAAAAAGNRVSATSAAVEALLHALEKYQGAQQAGNGPDALQQALAIQQYARLVAGRLDDDGAALHAESAAVTASGKDLATEARTLSSLRDRLASSGFTPEETTALVNAGLSQTQISSLLSTLTETASGSPNANYTLDTLSTDGDLADAVTAATADQTATASSLNGLADAMQPAIDTLRDDLTTSTLPTVSAGGPYTATAGTPIRLAATAGASSAAGTLSAAWDTTGSGTFDDATGLTPTVTFTTPGTRLVGVQVSGAAGGTATAYASVTVNPATAPPGVTVSPSGTSDVGVGDTTTFTAATSGQVGTVAWTVDGAPVATGTTYRPTWRDYDVGLHTVRVTVTGPGGSRIAQAGVLVSQPPGTTPPPVVGPDGDTLVSNGFDSTSVSGEDFTTAGTNVTPCLTASSDLHPTDGSIPGCADPAVDTDGHGVLRLTDLGGSEAGYILYTKPLPLSAGVDVTFSQYQYGGGGADGLSFFLADGSVKRTGVGGVGGALGYAQVYDGQGANQGLAGGLFGVGFDVYGNYGWDGSGLGAGCTTHGAYGHPEPELISVRGPQGATRSVGYCLIGDSGPLSEPLHHNTATRAGETDRVILTPAVDGPQRIIVERDTGDGNGFVRVLDIPAPADLPSTFDFGFSASTGAVNDYHEVSNLVVASDVPLDDTRAPVLGLAASATPTTVVLHPAVTTDGGTETVHPVLDATLTHATVTAVPTGTGWDCSATVVGSSTVSCTATGDLPVLPGTGLGTVTVPTSAATHTPTTATATLSSHDAPNPATATASVSAADPAPDLGLEAAAQPTAVELLPSVASTGGSEYVEPTLTAKLHNALITSIPTGAGWDCGATVLATTTVSCTATATLPVRARTSLGTVTVPTTPAATDPTSVQGTLISTDATGPAHAVATVAAPVRQPRLGLSAQAASTTVVLHPTITATGGDERAAPVLAATLTGASLTATPVGAHWDCTHSDLGTGVVSCVYTGDIAVTAGTALPDVTVSTSPVTTRGTQVTASLDSSDAVQPATATASVLAEPGPGSSTTPGSGSTTPISGSSTVGSSSPSGSSAGGVASTGVAILRLVLLAAASLALGAAVFVAGSRRARHRG